MHEKYFDEVLRMKLQQIEVPFREKDWTLLNAQLEPPIDSLTRTHLEDLSVSYQAENWDQLSRQLDLEHIPENHLISHQSHIAYDINLLNQSENFDTQIAETLDPEVKHLLHEYEASYQADDWDLLAEKLHGSFDNAIRAELSNYEAAYHPSDWKMMTEQLSIPFYSAIQSKFSSFQVPFRTLDWWRMAVRLSHHQWKEQSLLRPTSWKFYSVAATITLLFLAGISLLPLHRNATLSPLSLVTEVEQENRSTTQNQDSPLAESASEAETEVESKTLNGKNQESPVLVDQALTSSTNSSVPPLILVKPARETPQLVVLHSPPAKALLSSSELTDEAPRETSLYSGFGLNPIDLERNPLNLLRQVPELGKKKVKQLRAENKQLLPKIRLGLLGGFNLSRAELTTPGEKGYQAGVRVEMAFDEEWSVISGISYAEKRYQHRYLIYEANNNFQRLMDAEFKTVEIPVLARYTVPSSGKLSLYMQSGVIAMMTLEENYLIYDPNSVANASAPPSIDLRKLAPKEQRLNFHTYIGNIPIALGLQYELGKHINLQFEPYFLIDLQKKGSQGTKLYSSGINFGLVYQLGKIAAVN